MDFDKSIENTLEQIQKVMSTNCIIGSPIKTNNKILIPISKTTLAFGVGVGNNQKEDTDMGGAGGGASIDPVAFIVIHDDIKGSEGVQIIPVIGKNPAEDIIYNIGKVVNDKLGTTGNTSTRQDVTIETDDEDEDNVDEIKTKIKE